MSPETEQLPGMVKEKKHITFTIAPDKVIQAENMIGMNKQRGKIMR